MKEIKKYYDNGNLDCHYFIDNNDKFHGVYLSYYGTGKLFQECCFNHGNYRGVWKCFSKESQFEILSILKSENKILNSQFNGIKIEFNY